MELYEYYDKNREFFAQLEEPYPYETSEGVIKVPSLIDAASLTAAISEEEQKTKSSGIVGLFADASETEDIDEAEMTEEEKKKLSQLTGAGDLDAYTSWLYL